MGTLPQLFRLPNHRLLVSYRRGVKEMDKWEFYKDSTAKWRWRRIASNGKVVGASTEGYVNKSDCESNARRNGWTGF